MKQLGIEVSNWQMMLKRHLKKLQDTLELFS